MKLSRKGLALAFATTMGLGAAGQANADVYGLGYMLTSDLAITVTNPDGSNALGGAADYVFTTNSDATFNGIPDLTSGFSICNGTFPASTNCNTGPGPVLSGTVQNAYLGDGVVRGESDYTQTGTANGLDYSNAEAEITNATLVDFQPTRAEQIAESNLVDGFSATANTLVNSNTVLDLTFEVVNENNDGIFKIEFAAVLDAIAEINGLSDGTSLVGISWSATLTNDQGVVFNWAPNGIDGETNCGGTVAGITCVDDLDEVNLNLTAAASTNGNTSDDRSGSGEFEFTATGLGTGIYNLALNATTSTVLTNNVPVPGTLLLMGAGLLMAGGLRRRK